MGESVPIVYGESVIIYVTMKYCDSWKSIREPPSSFRHYQLALVLVTFSLKTENGSRTRERAEVSLILTKKTWRSSRTTGVKLSALDRYSTEKARKIGHSLRSFWRVKFTLWNQSKKYILLSEKMQGVQNCPGLFYWTFYEYNDKRINLKDEKGKICSPF